MISDFEFLPVSKENMLERGWYYYDFLMVTGDAYVDHPSFGAAVISRLLEAEGFRVAVLSQPEWKNAESFASMGKPRLGVLVTSGNIDSMVAHYTAAKKRRSDDSYSPGKKAGLRPDRAVIVYSNRAREAFGEEVPIIIGGLEASLRRFAHYDYWDDKVRRSILLDSRADMLVYGMGESATREIALRLKRKISVSDMRDIPGTAFVERRGYEPGGAFVMLPSYEKVVSDKPSYAYASKREYEEHDPVRGLTLIQEHDGRALVVNPPAAPLAAHELDRIAGLPFTREYHPMYEELGGVPAIDEVRFSVIHNRGCFGACSFCSLAFHQGRTVTSRSHESVVREVESMTSHPLFRGYVSDVGGPTANFRHPSCAKQLTEGVCMNKNCLFPEPCGNLDADHSDYLALLRKLRAVPKVKKVFVRSGIRYDYLLEDKSSEFLSELVKYHISGQLKVAPEHCSDGVLGYMGKPKIQVYEKFMEKYRGQNMKHDKEQYLVPYLMSSHPGSTLKDAVELAEYLHRSGRVPEQVQDFYPTPGTISTCMYYTGIDPRTMDAVYVPKTAEEKAMQRALLQWNRPENKRLVRLALRTAGREDLIGYSRHCLVTPERREAAANGKRGKTESNKADAPGRGEGLAPKRKQKRKGG